MIIVCQSCKASFLVPASVFHSGARIVRCGKCHQVWREFPNPKTEGLFASQSTKDGALASEPALSIGVKAETVDATILQGADKTSPNSATMKRSIRLPFNLKKLISFFKFVFFLILALSVLSVACVFVFHSAVVAHFPAAKPYYESLGIGRPAYADVLLLKNIKSERRYTDGAMQLVVEGDVANISGKTQVLPLINVDALGPDERVIQSWRITPSKATLDPDSTLPFTSSIVSPEGTVVDVDLTFIEPMHAKH